jgi:hypothetical protein
VTVRNSSDAVFAPTVGARVRVIVRKEISRGSMGAVVFAHRAPLALRKIRNPALPMRLSPARLLEPALFRSQCEFLSHRLVPFSTNSVSVLG